jgi:hypothetical protein
MLMRRGVASAPAHAPWPLHVPAPAPAPQAWAADSDGPLGASSWQWSWDMADHLSGELAKKCHLTHTHQLGRRKQSGIYYIM